MRRVCVTGAGGFIGSHLTEALLASGIETRAVVHYNSLGSWGWLNDIPEAARKGLEVVAADLGDAQGIKRAVSGCDTIFHLAALISIPFSYDHPEMYVETNVRGTMNVLCAARDLEVERLVVTSTSEVYGSAQTLPINEDHPLHPQSPYAASKVGSDQLALSFHRSFGVPVSVMRPFNTYGPRQSARAIIPATIIQVLSGAKTIKLGALHPTRDFTFVQDTARAFMAVAQSKKTLGQVVHAGSGSEISIGEMVEMVKEICGSDAKIVTDQQRLRPAASEVTRLWACNDRISALTQWSPQFAGKPGLRRGIEASISWFKRPENARFFKADKYAV